MAEHHQRWCRRWFRTVSARITGIVAVALGLMAGPAADAATLAWHEVTTPAPGPSQATGGYAAGCLAGAEALPGHGPGFQVIRLSRRRNYGHPELIRYLRQLGEQIAAAGIGRAMIGDLSQPRGGPMPNGHASHQIGLDADIWLRLDAPLLPEAEREGVTESSMVDTARFEINREAWSDRQATLIRLAASDSRVSRIFVHPVIKDTLCRGSWPDRAWLARVRPWFGHAAHLHVRLRCPADSPACEDQPPVPPGDGCGEELASWFPKPGQEAAKPAPARPKPPPPPLPVACAGLLR